MCLLLWPIYTHVRSINAQQQLELQWQKAYVENHTPKPTPVEPGAKPTQKPKQGARRKFPATKLMIPELGLEAIVVEGVSLSKLKQGPGHFPGTAAPGDPGNCCIAGHRNVYGSWFRNLDKLSPGDAVILSTPDGDYIYQVTDTFIVRPSDLSVLDQGLKCKLTLITCTPVPKPTHRLIVVAELIACHRSDTQPSSSIL